MKTSIFVRNVQEVEWTTANTKVSVFIISLCSFSSYYVWVSVKTWAELTSLWFLINKQKNNKKDFINRSWNASHNWVYQEWAYTYLTWLQEECVKPMMEYVKPKEYSYPVVKKVWGSIEIFCKCSYSVGEITNATVKWQDQRTKQGALYVFLIRVTSIWRLKE